MCRLLHYEGERAKKEVVQLAPKLWQAREARSANKHGREQKLHCIPQALTLLTDTSSPLSDNLYIHDPSLPHLAQLRVVLGLRWLLLLHAGRQSFC
jgi:hypothetical protein